MALTKSVKSHNAISRICNKISKYQIVERKCSGVVKSLNDSTNKGFKILGLQQIAIGSLSKKELSEFWIDLMGIKKISSFKSEVRVYLPEYKHLIFYC